MRGYQTLLLSKWYLVCVFLFLVLYGVVIFIT